MSGHYNWYPSQAHNRTDVISAMTKKIRECEGDIEFFNQGLKKIAGLKEMGLYKLQYKNRNFFVQCWKFRRDHVEFRIIACDKQDSEIRLLATGDLSLAWNQFWECTPAQATDAPLYITWPWKTKHFDKLLKGL